MAQFPTGIPISKITLVPIFTTISHTSDSGIEVRRKKRAFAQFDVMVDFHPMTKANMQTLYDFYMARSGSYEAFYIYDVVTMDHDSLLVGTGDGSTVTFDIPGKSTSSQTVYVNGIVQTNNVTVFYNYGSGAESSDQVTFSSAPSIGDILSCNFTGFLRVRCRFMDDTFTRDNLYGNVFQTSIKLKGLKFV